MGQVAYISGNPGINVDLLDLKYVEKGFLMQALRKHIRNIKVSKALGESWHSVTLPNFDIKDAAQFPK